MLAYSTIAQTRSVLFAMLSGYSGRFSVDREFLLQRAMFYLITCAADLAGDIRCDVAAVDTGIPRPKRSWTFAALPGVVLGYAFVMLLPG